MLGCGASQIVQCASIFLNATAKCQKYYSQLDWPVFYANVIGQVIQDSGDPLYATADNFVCFKRSVKRNVVAQSFREVGVTLKVDRQSIGSLV